jgi:tetratricopeptide (TPR) repeat protein
MKNGLWYVFGVLAVGILAAGGWWYVHQAPELPPYALQLQAGDAVTIWDFKGAYTGSGELTKRATDEITRLKGLFGTKEATAYELYVSIANQYDLLGDGKNELAYLEKALAIDAEHTGLAWYNAGVLYERLGAYHTARFAFEHAAEAQPIPQYQSALSDFLKAHPQVVSS